MADSIDRKLQQALRALSKGDTRKAKAACHGVLAADGLNGDALHLLGLAWRQEGNLPEALHWLRKAVAASPRFHGAWYNLADALAAASVRHEAEHAYQQALELKPDFIDARINLGNLYLAQRDWEQAKAQYEQVLAARPEDLRALTNLGLAQRLTGHSAAAEALYRKALALDPRNATARVGLGNTLLARHAFGEAAALLEETVALGLDPANAATSLGNALMRLGRPGDAIAAYRKALAAEPASGVAQSNLLHALHFDPSVSPAELADAHRRWGEQVLVAAPKRARSRAPHHPLRVGYVSADFRRHPVAFLFEPVLAAHDVDRFRIYCYSATEEADEFTARLRERCAWRDIAGLSDEQVCALVQSDEIDVLVDLSGHTAGNRLGVFAHAPAPVQLSWLGYFDTTGLPTMDYLVSDAYSTPPQSQPLFVEKLWCLPEVRFCYLAPDYAPPPAAAPCLKNGYVTFGSFNRLEKLNERVLRLWAAILAALPESRLLLKAKAFDDAGGRRAWLARFAAHGVTEERLILRGHSDHPAMLAEYAQIDVALDVFPFTGGLTTLEALWMGVPVVTLAGTTLLARQSASFLHAIGRDEWIAEDEQRYVEIASALARDCARLQTARAALRERMRSSPLCDAKRFCRQLEAAFAAMAAERAAG